MMRKIPAPRASRPHQTYFGLIPPVAGRGGFGGSTTGPPVGGVVGAVSVPTRVLVVAAPVVGGAGLVVVSCPAVVVVSPADVVVVSSCGFDVVDS
jgi:hypothetical protein